MNPHILVMADIPIVWLDQPYVSSHVFLSCVHMHLYMFYLHTTPCIHVCVCSWKMESLSRVWMKYGSNLALRPPSPPLRAHSPDALLGPFGQTKAGVHLGWGVRGEVYTGRVWDRLHNQPGTLLSNYSTIEERRERGGGGAWDFWARVAGHLRALSAVWLCVCGKACSHTDCRGQSCSWLVRTPQWRSSLPFLDRLIGCVWWVLGPKLNSTTCVMPAVPLKGI